MAVRNGNNPARWLAWQARELGVDRLSQEDEVMGDIMLFGVLEMPPELWHDDSSIDRAQRHSRYKQAAQRIRDDEEQLAAKDAEIADLVAQRDKARYNAEAADDFRGAYLRERNEALEQLTEARECVGRLWRALDAVRGAGMETCMVERDGHDDQIEAVTAALAALAATPEHLR